MELEFTAASWQQDDTGTKLVLSVPDGRLAREFVRGHREETRPWVAKLEPKRKRRSLDANAYLWVLLHKLSAKLGIPAKQIYRQLVPDVGGNCYIYPVRKDAKDHWVRIWESKGDGWVCEDMGESKLDGYVNVRNYYGSSEYDTEQMSRLIDLVVQECQQLHIETATPRELALLKEEWDEKQQKRGRPPRTYKGVGYTACGQEGGVGAG